MDTRADGKNLNPADEARDGASMVSAGRDDLPPDLVDLIFAYIMEEFPDIAARVAELKEATRKEFSGIETYIPQRSQSERQRQVHEVLSLFNGRNATEVARRLNISRATVYRVIKTAGGDKTSQFSGK